MRIYKVMKFWSNGWNDGHTCIGTFSRREYAEAKMKSEGLKEVHHKGVSDWRWYSDHILEEEIQ